MSLKIVMMFLGWIFTIVPLLVFLVISTVMIVGAGKDDDLIKALTLMGVSIFLMGAITLAIVYLTNLI
ncbi:MAG: hypothetical protein HQ488_05570 [Parcubacteria group bacterium]|nr:hypothetical protein [Parcubacteria group bacterium]